MDAGPSGAAAAAALRAREAAAQQPQQLPPPTVQQDDGAGGSGLQVGNHAGEVQADRLRVKVAAGQGRRAGGRQVRL